MSFDLDIAIAIQQYRKDTTGLICTTEEILAEPRYQRVWEWWQSLAYYKQHNYFERLEDAPNGIKMITVMGPDLQTVYEWKDGAYQKSSEQRIEEVKDIYGSE